jgi:hypothetical protein
MTAVAIRERRVAWAPFSGTSQELFLACPVWEALYTGTRGPGKTDALLMDFAQHVGEGWGPDWRGVLFRQEYKPLSEVVKKSEKWFRRIFPRARFLRSPGEFKWVFPDGEELLLRAFARPADYWDYHGHEYPWIAWEELTAWSGGECYHLMKSCNRSPRLGMPRKYRATCNPYGPGHNWVKAYFIDPAPAGVPFVADRSSAAAVAAEYGVEVESNEALQTVALHGHYRENRALMEAQPDYPLFIAAAAANPEQAKAWLKDDWDIVAGGIVDDLWDRARHVLPPFVVPSTWRIDRAYDWGSTRPFSVGWWAEANGEAVQLADGRTFAPPRGSLIRIAEWYGWDGKTPNVGLKMTDAAIGREIVAREKALGFGMRVQAGPADSSIFDKLPGKTSPADEMASHGAKFVAADKSPGSRRRGAEAIRRLLTESAKDRPEGPGLWIVEGCRQWIRTVPTLPRSDADPDDVDTDAEDHTWDETRYRCMAVRRAVTVSTYRT